MAQIKLVGKLVIQATLRIKTGLHIGGSSDFAPIGAVDSPFIRDPFTHQPVIPGSSLKGKMRTLLARVRDEENEDGRIPEPVEDEDVVRRLFGYSDKKSSQPSRLQFADIFIQKESEKRFSAVDTDTYMGEVKSENTINRGNGVANPRQIERVPAGMTFDFRLVYNIENESEMEEDMKVLADGFRLLKSDYLGGHGSRGYGRVEFSEFSVNRINAKTGETEEFFFLMEQFQGTQA